jgi:DNA-binding LacI/PurR family transcriptional regulator
LVIKKGRPSSIVDVAESAGVSIQTVSNVLNFPERVRPKTRERVLKVVKTLDYTPNLSARRLRSKKSSSIAVRVDANSSPGLFQGFIQDDFVFELIEAAEERQIKVIAYTAASEEVEVEKLKKFIKSRDTDGIILTSTKVDDPRLNYLEKNDFPFLSFGKPWGHQNLYSTSHPWVDIDGASGIAEATAMLWKKGHRYIGFAGWVSPNGSGRAAQSVGDDRYFGWKTTLLKLAGKAGVGGDMTLSNLAVFGEQSIESGRQSARRLLDAVPKLDAVVCVSDTVALGCLLEFQRISRQQISITGFDNSPISKEFGFSSLDQNLSSVANSALKILMGDTGNQVRKVDFAGEKTAAHVLLKPILIVR